MQSMLESTFILQTSGMYGCNLQLYMGFLNAVNNFHCHTLNLQFYRNLLYEANLDEVCLLRTATSQCQSAQMALAFKHVAVETETLKR